MLKIYRWYYTKNGPVSGFGRFVVNIVSGLLIITTALAIICGVAYLVGQFVVMVVHWFLPNVHDATLTLDCVLIICFLGVIIPLILKGCHLVGNGVLEDLRSEYEKLERSQKEKYGA